MSHPTRVRGLKYTNNGGLVTQQFVAPYTGAWIEINQGAISANIEVVAPYTGAWIEINFIGKQFEHKVVAPYTGAWIEIYRVGLVCTTSQVSHSTGVCV